MSQSDTSTVCQNCRLLQKELDTFKVKNRELEDINEKLTQELSNMMLSDTPKSLGIDVELELKKGILGNLAQSQIITSSETDTSSGGGANLKKIQQELRVSKKAEQLAKEKLLQTKKILEKTEKDFQKYKEDSEQRMESYKNEIGILQKHYDQLQNSLTESEQQMDRNSNGGGSNSNSELIKIIEDYSKSNEAKAKEIESLSEKVNKKSNKIDELKKCKADNDNRISKLKGTLDNVKTFLKLLNTNFMKSLRQQNASLKEQYQASEKEFVKEIENIKSQVTSQINKIIYKREKELQTQIQSEQTKVHDLQTKLDQIKNEYEQKIKVMNENQTQELGQAKHHSSKKIQELKARIKDLGQEQNSRSMTDDNERDQLSQQLSTKEKELHILQLQLNSEKDKHQIKLQEVSKDIEAKQQQLIEFKDKEAQLIKKLEDQESRHRSEVQKLMEKFDNDRISWIQREAEVSGQRESERLKELKELYESKSRDKDEELQRLRDKVNKNEIEYLKIRDEIQVKNEKAILTIKEQESEISSLKVLANEAIQKCQKKTDKVKQLKEAIKESQTSILNLSKDKEALKRDQNRLEIENQSIKNIIQERDGNIKQSKQEIQDLLDQMKQINMQHSIDLEKMRSQLTSEKSQKELELAQLSTQIQSLQTQLFNHQELINSKNRIIEEQLVQIQASESLQDQLQQSFIQLQEGNQFLETQLNEAQQKILELENRVKIQKKKILKSKKKPTIQGQSVETQTDDIKLESQVIVQPEFEILARKQIQTTDIDIQTEGEFQIQQKEEEPLDNSPKSVRSSGFVKAHQNGKINEFNNDFQEEDSYSPKLIEEAEEKYVAPKADFQADLAFRQPGPFNAAGRPPAPRPQGMQGRGRGMAPQFRPSGMPMPQQRPSPFGQQTPTTQQVESQPTQSQEAPQNQQQEEIKQEPEVVNVPEMREKKSEEEIKATFPIRSPPAPVLSEHTHDRLKKEDKLETTIKQEKEQKSAQSKNQTVITEASKKPEEEKKAPVANQGGNNAQGPQGTILDFRNNRFFGMINGFLGFLTRRRQGYTGRPAASMYYDEKKGRYVIEGEDESDDDVPPPPPPAAKKKTEEVKQEPEQPKQEATGLDSLTRTAYGGVVGRGRGRGRGGAGAPAASRFPQTFNPSQLAETRPSVTIIEEEKTARNEEQKVQVLSNVEQQQQELNKNEQEREYREENSELYTTTMDISMLQTSSDNLKGISQNLKNSNQQNDQQSLVAAQEYEAIQQELQNREIQWLDKFNQQQDKIKSFKYRVSMLQQELTIERDQNEQTIENFTILCQDLKFKGMDEVEDLQSDIQVLKEHLKTLAHDKAYLELQVSQLTDSHRFSDQEIQELRQQLRDAKYQLIHSEIDRELSRVTNHGSPSQSNEAQGTTSIHNSGRKADEEEKYSSGRQILEMQIEVENLKWQKSITEAEKFQKSLDLKESQQLLEKLRAQYNTLEQDNLKLSDENRRLIQEQQQFGQEQLTKAEREKDTLREMLQKIQAERDRVSEQNRERINEYELRIKKIEGEKAKSDQDISRTIREKETQIDQLKNQNLAANQSLTQSQDEIKWLQQQVKEFQLKVNSLNHKRQSESEQTEQMMKAQMNQIQNILLQKTSQLEKFESKHNEINQELESMNTIRHKLTENIIYLQNEIRKRDELLENSEFGDFDLIGGDEDSLLAPEDESIRGGDLQSNDDGNAGAGPTGAQSMKNFQQMKKKRKTFGQQLQNQLEETRLQLKTQIEERMRAERTTDQLQNILRKYFEGLGDIHKILDQQTKSYQDQISVGEQSSQLFDTQEEESKEDQVLSLDADQIQPDESVHQIITKVFGLQRLFDSELSELRHKIKMLNMQVEESESLKFDLEIMQDEKSMMENEIQQGRNYQKELETKIQELRMQINENQDNEETHKNEIRIIREQQEVRMGVLKQEYEHRLQIQRDETQAEISRLHDTFKSQVLPQYKQKYQTKYQSLKDQIQSLKSQYQSQLDESQNTIHQLEQNNQSLLNQTQMKIEQDQDALERLQEQMKFLEIQKQELQNQVVQQSSSYEQRIDIIEKELKQSLKELEENKESFTKDTERLVKNFDQVAQKLKAKNDQKKTKLKEYSSKMKQLIQVYNEETQKQGQEVETLKTQNDLLAQENSQLQENVQGLKQNIQELEESKNQVQQKSPEKKESASKEEVDSLYNKIQELEKSLIDKDSEIQRTSEELFNTFKQKALQLKQKISDLKSQNKQLKIEGERQREQLLQQIELIKQENPSEINNEKDLQVQLSNLQTSLSEKQVELTSKDQEIERQQSDIERYLEEIANLKTELENLNRNQQNVEQQKPLLQQDHPEISQAEEKYQELESQLSQKDLEIQNLSESLNSLQDQNQLLIDAQAKLEQEHLASIEEVMQLAANEWETKLANQSALHESQLQELIDRYTSREEEFKQKTEEVVKKLKEDIKKLKSKVKHLTEDLGKSQADKLAFEVQIKELKDQFRAQLELVGSSSSAELDSLTNSIKDLELSLEIASKSAKVQDDNMQNLQTRYDQVVTDNNEVREQIVKILDEMAGVKIGEEEQEWKQIIAKVQEILQNYEEDKRSLKTLINEKEDLAQQAERYYQEKESIQSEKSIIQDKYEKSNAGKLESKVRILEEESREMKSDFYIKINSYVEEISMLKDKLSRKLSILYSLGYEPLEEESHYKEQEDSHLEADKQSFAQGKKIDDNQVNFMDQSKTSHINQNKSRNDQDTSNVQQRSGIFNSIASFFLTDSELDPTTQGNQ